MIHTVSYSCYDRCKHARRADFSGQTVWEVMKWRNKWRNMNAISSKAVRLLYDFAVTHLHLTDLSMRLIQQVRSRCNICTCSDVVEIKFCPQKVKQQSVTPTQSSKKAVWFVVWLVVWLAVWEICVMEVDHYLTVAPWSHWNVTKPDT